MDSEDGRMNKDERPSLDRENSFSSEKDLATAIADPQYSYNEAQERRVVRKIDLVLTPILFIIYGLLYYDKALLGSAALFGMTTDLQLIVVDSSTTPATRDSSRYSWCTSIFYFGMLFGLLPTSLIAQRLHIGRFVGVLTVLWGGTVMCTAAVKSYQGLLVQRFFLGVLESAISPAWLQVTAAWYTQSEQALRISFWYSATGAFTIIGSIASYGFAQIHGDLRPWQYSYLCMGAITTVLSVLVLLIPNSPVDAWFLSLDERKIAVERLRSGQTGVRCQKVKILEALADWKVITFGIILASIYVVNGGVTGFGPLIVSSLGFTTLQSILLQFPLGGVVMIFMWLFGYITSRKGLPQLRIPLLMFSCLPVIAGCAMIWKSDWTVNHGATAVAGYTLLGFFGPQVTLLLSIAVPNVAGNTKKAVTAAVVFIGYCVGNIIGPQLVKLQTVAQHYPEVWKAIIICNCIVFALSGVLLVYFRYENSKRDREDLRADDKVLLAFEDRTDKENHHFRYAI